MGWYMETPNKWTTGLKTKTKKRAQWDRLKNYHFVTGTTKKGKELLDLVTLQSSYP